MLNLVFVFTCTDTGATIPVMCHSAGIIHRVLLDTSVADPDPPDPHVFGPDPDLSIILLSSKTSKKNFDSYCFMTSFGLFL